MTSSQGLLKVLTSEARISLTFVESSNELKTRRQPNLGITRAIAVAEGGEETGGYVGDALLMGYGLGVCQFSICGLLTFRTMAIRIDSCRANGQDARPNKTPALQF